MYTTEGKKEKEKRTNKCVEKGRKVKTEMKTNERSLVRFVCRCVDQSGDFFSSPRNH